MRKRYRYAHPLTKTAQGLLLDLDADTDSQTWRGLSEVLNKATEAAKDIEEDRMAAEKRAEALRAALALERERAIPRRDFGLINRIDAALAADDEALA